ncbi:protein kinase domain-containing protein [Aureispira anguillae]|uniref:non-specific serine/threonine protein kinase n=1 Tax=Aureispira anguillae TaxID=2864201 RepID=A0A916DTF8_9BACT|nr:hypothetical protein [Aureispira anguillae]BDS11757.1 hypothetical protein AsAng_0024710 [Aureispira anguillae]
MKVRNTTTSEILQLASTPFARGGEGLLYRVVAPKGYAAIVAKIYHPPKRTKERWNKLRYLVQNPPVFENKEQAMLISWPIALLEKKQAFMGFLMPFANGELLEVLATTKLPQYLSEEWQRFKLGTIQASKLRQKVCFNIAVALYHIHKTGHYVMVDLKPDNILIQQNGLVSLVDMDSVEIVNGNQTLFAAAMATPEFAPPEFHQLTKRTQAIPISWDQFSIAIIFYKVLLGIHPFAATTQGKYETAVGLGQKVKHGLYVHNKVYQDYFDTIPFPHAAFYQLPTVLQYLFNRCFIQGIQRLGARPTAEDWCLALGEEKEEAEAPTYFIPMDGLTLETPALEIASNSIFVHSFEATFGATISKQSSQLIDKIKEEQRSWKKLIGKSLLGVAALGTVVFLGIKYYFVLPIVFIAALLLWYNQRKQKRQDPTPIFLPTTLHVATKWKPLLNEKIQLLFEGYQNQKKAYQQLISSFYQTSGELQKKWEENTKVYKKKCRQLNQEKWQKNVAITQERNQQPLWKQFVGRTSEEKQRFLKKKYLPSCLQNLADEQQQKIKTIDAEHQAIWQDLEYKFYEELDLISKNVSFQRVKAKKEAEDRFVEARQKIIDAIQAQKKETNQYYEAQQKIIKDSVHNYCEQLDAIESLALNKKMLLNQRLDLKYKTLLSEMELEQMALKKALTTLEKDFDTKYEQLLEPLQIMLKKLGLVMNLEQ